MNYSFISSSDNTIKTLDREIFEVELMCVLLPVHGLTKDLPFSLEIESTQKNQSNHQTYSFSVLTLTREKLISITSIVHNNLIQQSKNFNVILKRIIALNRFIHKKSRYN